MDERAPRPPEIVSEPLVAGDALALPVLHVVDDDIIFLAGIERVLRRLDCTVRVFTSPEEALACFAEKEPDLIFVDVHMPRLDGIELLQHALESRREHRARLFLDSAGPPSNKVRCWCEQHHVELVDKREMLDRDWMRSMLERWRPRSEAPDRVRAGTR